MQIEINYKKIFEIKKITKLPTKIIQRRNINGGIAKK